MDGMLLAEDTSGADAHLREQFGKQPYGSEFALDPLTALLTDTPRRRSAR